MHPTDGLGHPYPPYPGSDYSQVARSPIPNIFQLNSPLSHSTHSCEFSSSISLHACNHLFWGSYLHTTPPCSGAWSQRQGNMTIFCQVFDHFCKNQKSLLEKYFSAHECRPTSRQCKLNSCSQNKRNLGCNLDNISGGICVIKNHESIHDMQQLDNRVGHGMEEGRRDPTSANSCNCQSDTYQSMQLSFKNSHTTAV